MELDNVNKEIASRALCALIGFLLMITGTVFVTPPLMSLVIIVIGFFVFVASFGAADMSDLQRIAGAGFMIIGLFCLLFAANPDLITGSTALAQNPGAAALCGYSEENPCTVRHLKTFLYSLFWR
ncbi:MAG: hypothetical protein KBC50_02430 [Candidatus Pacebacteria bacterium]|nr:hypothetical protein [Candidatus Paceibacterota bacterium]